MLSLLSKSSKLKFSLNFRQFSKTSDTSSTTSTNTSNTTSNWETIEEIQRKQQFYRQDIITFRTWLSLQYIKEKGRCYPAYHNIIPKSNRVLYFPLINGITLNNENIQLPSYQNHIKVRIICFSIKDVGSKFLQSWKDAIIKKYDMNHTNVSINIIHIHIIEYKFLEWLMKNMLIKSLQQSICSKEWNNTIISFPNITEFAANLLLPNKYTGYIHIIDNQGFIRWKACGEAQEHEIEYLYKCIDELLAEN